MPYQQVIKYRDSIDIVTCIGACGTEHNYVPISQHNGAQLPPIISIIQHSAVQCQCANEHKCV